MESIKKFFFLICFLTSGLFLNAQNDGDGLFGYPGIHTIRITFQQPSFWDSLVANYPLDKMMEADVEIDGFMLKRSGVQLKGNSSYNSYPGVKKSMNIDLNEFVQGQDYDGIKSLNLNNGFKDPTMLREKLFLDFCRTIGLPAPRCGFAKLYLNGTYWGFYTLVEQVNHSFLGNEFPDKDGNLFKGDPHGDLTWKGIGTSLYYPHYELKTNENVNDWSDLVALINCINNSPVEHFYDSLEKYMDTESFLKYWAANLLFVNLDSYNGSGHNYYIYHSTDSRKFSWIMWDVNEAFGNFNMGINLDGILKLGILFIPQPAQSRPLLNKMLKDNSFKSRYIEKLCQYTNLYFRNDVYNPVIDSLANLIRPDYFADPNKMFSNTNFNDNLEHDLNLPGMPGGGNIAGLKSFISTRRESLLIQLAGQGCILGMNDLSNQQDGFELFPNPAINSVKIIISGKNQLSINHLNIYNSIGEMVRQVNDKNTEFVLDLSDLESGIYYVSMNNKPWKKLVIQK